MIIEEKTAPPSEVALRLHPPRWHRFAKRLQGGAVLAPLFFSVFYISETDNGFIQEAVLAPLFFSVFYISETDNGFIQETPIGIQFFEYQ